ncbi:MAG: zf-HC2 domain-containing protein [Planctomycetota bacterium]|nr:zf-HC2 domain-containing protein [Planctomycetota bacterium]
MEDALLEKLSAYADGELEPAEAAEVAAALAEHPELRRVVSGFRVLDAQAAKLPVPPIDDETGRALWSEVSFRTLESKDLPGARTLGTTAWNEMAEGLPPAPEVREDRWNQVWQGVRKNMPARPAEPAEHALPLGDLSPVNMPAVSDRAAARPAVRRRPLAFWFGSSAMAAALVLGVTAFLFRHHSGGTGTDRVAHDEPLGAKVLDDRYFLLTKHVPGVDTPVVCFVLKDEDADVEKH